MPIYLGTHKLKELYVGGHKIKEAYLGSTKVYSATVIPAYEIWTNDTTTHTSYNGASSTAWNLNTPTSTTYNYILLEYNTKMRIESGGYGGYGGIIMYISQADYSRSIEFAFNGSTSNITYRYIYALTSLFTAWNNASGITTNTTGTETDYAGTYRYVQNSTYFSGVNTWYKVRYIFDQANKKLYFYFGDNKIYLGYADLSTSSGDIVNKMNIYSSLNGSYISSSEVSVKNIICGGFTTLQAAINY